MQTPCVSGTTGRASTRHRRCEIDRKLPDLHSSWGFTPQAFSLAIEGVAVAGIADPPVAEGDGDWPLAPVVAQPLPLPANGASPADSLAVEGKVAFSTALALLAKDCVLDGRLGESFFFSK